MREESARNFHAALIIQNLFGVTFLSVCNIGSITSRCSGKEPVLLPELTAGLMDLAL